MSSFAVSEYTSTDLPMETGGKENPHGKWNLIMNASIRQKEILVPETPHHIELKK